MPAVVREVILGELAPVVAGEGALSAPAGPPKPRTLGARAAAARFRHPPKHSQVHAYIHARIGARTHMYARACARTDETEPTLITYISGSTIIYAYRAYTHIDDVCLHTFTGTNTVPALFRFCSRGSQRLCSAVLAHAGQACHSCRVARPGW